MGAPMTTCAPETLTLRSLSDNALIAIERLQAHEPPEGYWLAFSGGKDSIVIYDLAKRAGVKFDAHYNITGIDPPAVVQFIRQHYPAVSQDKPPHSFWMELDKRGLPRRQGRWCCEFLKERGGHGRIVVTGVRWAESTRRKATRRLYELCYKDGTKHFLNPLLDWTNQEVWAYIRERQIPYCTLYDEGYKRIGCILCPMASRAERKRDMARWPKITEAWRRAADRYWQHSEAAKTIGSPDDFWTWWLSDTARRDKAQMVMFE